MIRTLNLNRQTTAILENAFNIGLDKEVNSIWMASFSLPINDPKIDKVKLLEYVEIEGDLYRIIPKLTSKSRNSVTFQCEHVLATLLNTPLFKYHQLTNYTTKQVLQYLIDQQFHKHWKLGTVEFTRYFHYSWENENLLSAIFSVPKAFDEPYIWTFDTNSYPWTLNLIRPSNIATCRIKEGYNLIDFEIEENPMGMFNRIYPVGAGEGVNILTIESVNNGVPYLEDRKPDEEIIATVWPDKRFTDPESLKASGQALLDEWKKPKVYWKTTAADVSSITGLSIDKLKCGAVVRLQLDNYPTTDLRIMKESRKDIKGDPGNTRLEIGNVTEDLATTQADLQRRQQINELYSQGATNIMNFTYQDNADSNIPATIPFYIDDDVVNVNTVELTFRTRRFRAYSRATEGGGAIVKSTSSGGGTVKSTSSGGGTTATSSSGGGTSRSTASGGGTSRSTVSGGGASVTSGQKEWGTGDRIVTSVNIEGGTPESHAHFVSLAPISHSHNVSVPAHSHSFTVPAHSHDFSTPNHTHNVNIPNHTHSIEIPNHTHEIELPNHIHDVKHEIVELSTLPSSVTIKVDGNTVPHTSTSGNRINLVDYMSKDSSGRITRGRHEVTITPNGLGRIEADLILRVFIQSQLGVTL